MINSLKLKVKKEFYPIYLTIPAINFPKKVNMLIPSGNLNIYMEHLLKHHDVIKITELEMIGNLKTSQDCIIKLMNDFKGTLILEGDRTRINKDNFKTEILNYLDQ